jgi:hypothetical protein
MPRSTRPISLSSNNATSPGDQELALVQSLADTHWRIARIPSLEMGIYALGRLEFAELFPEYDEGSRKILIDAKVFLAYQRQLVNLGIQEGRLRRQAEKDLAALQALQEPRIRETEARLNEAAQAYFLAVRRNQHESFDPQALGFDFTVDQVQQRALAFSPDLLRDRTAAHDRGRETAAQTLSLLGREAGLQE